MRRKLTILGLTALALSLAIPSAFARGPHHGRGGGHGKMFRQLDLSEEQRDAIKQIRSAQKDQAKALRGAMKANRKATFEAWQATNPDRAQLLSLSAERAAIKGELETLKIDFKLAAFQVLTPEQQTELRAKAAERFERKQSRKARRGERSRGGDGDGPPRRGKRGKRFDDGDDLGEEL